MTTEHLTARSARRHDDDGFTLIELLIVIVILGVLAGITVFAVSAFNGSGISASCKSDVKNVEVASEAFFAKNGTYAAGIGSVGSTATNTLVGGGYLKEPPPTTNYTVNYTIPSGSPVPSISGTLSAAQGGGPC